jgi:TetR/AcrR family transcriptional regulator
MTPRPLRPGKTRLRRDEILDEATRLFAERGYEGTSMADLAERVGLRKASLFHHFASKEVLYAAVLERLVQAVGTAMMKAAVQSGSYTDRLDNMSDAITSVLGDQPFAARLLIREVMDWGPVVRDGLAQTMMSVLEGAEQFIKGGQAEGVFVETDAKQLIVSVMGVHFMPFAIGGIMERFIGTNPADPEFVEERRKVVREHARYLILSKRAKK